jgi:hypothetical protein
MPRLARVARSLICVTVSCLCGRALAAQSVQAIRGLGSSVVVQDSIQRRAELIRSVLVGLASIQSAEARNAPEIRSLAASVRDAAGRALDHRSDPRQFALAFDDFLDALAKLRYEVDQGRVQDAGRQTMTVTDLVPPDQEAFVAPVPIQALVPDVVFTVSAEVLFGRGDVSPSFGLSTNLLGAAAGTAFNAIGSDALKKYFQDYISVATSFSGGGTKPNADLGLGLGQFHLGTDIWPILTLSELDSADNRLPAAIHAKGGSGSWSTPGLALALFIGGVKKTQAAICRGQLAPILTLGVSAPFYYPGDVFSALAALFTSSRGKYERSGGVAFRLGVSFPILPIKRDTSAAKSTCPS